MPDRIEWFGAHLSGRELEWLRKPLATTYVNDGPLTTEFERRIAETVRIDHAIAVTSGTAAIALALMAVGIGPGDEVLVPDLTFAATANAVRLAGAEVRLVDIEPQFFGIDVELAAKAMGPRTGAVVAVDVNGRGVDYAKLQRLCRDSGLFLICDSAEGFGSCHGDTPLGCFGDAACFSFSANKTITSGQGGAVVTKDAKIAARVRQLKDQGRVRRGTGGEDLHPTLGFNFKFTDLQAAVALAQFDDLDARLALAHARDNEYRKHLGHLMPPLRRGGENRQWADILLPDRATRIRVVANLAAQDIDCRPFWFPMHRQLPYVDDRPFPVASDISERGLWLPSRYDLNAEEIGRVCSVVLEAL